MFWNKALKNAATTNWVKFFVDQHLKIEQQINKVQKLYWLNKLLLKYHYLVYDDVNTDERLKEHWDCCEIISLLWNVLFYMTLQTLQKKFFVLIYVLCKKYANIISFKFLVCINNQDIITKIFYKIRQVYIMLSSVQSFNYVLNFISQVVLTFSIFCYKILFQS